MIELRVLRSFMISKNRIQGVKRSRGQVRTFEKKPWNPSTLGPLNPYDGMTLVEVITVLAILAILAAVVIPKLGLPTTSSGASVDGAAYMIASDIRYAQEFAMANGVSKSVNFTSGSSTYIFSPSSTLDPSGQLPSEIRTRDNYTITFNSLGEPTTGGGGSVRVWDGVQTRTINVVNYTGKVDIT
jgi:prepilin-type N-terminal cleavage/methylation domain-containing protein